MQTLIWQSAVFCWHGAERIHIEPAEDTDNVS